MSASEHDAPLEGAGSQGQDATEPIDEDPTLEEIAANFVATFFENVAGAAVEMVQQTATAFEESLDTAIHGKYTSSRLAKDSALLWARNVKFITRLFSVGSPTEPLVPTPGGSGSPTTSSSTPPPGA
jgi:hypothetical protein